MSFWLLASMFWWSLRHKVQYKIKHKDDFYNHLCHEELFSKCRGKSVNIRRRQTRKSNWEVPNVIEHRIIIDNKVTFDKRGELINIIIKFIGEAFLFFTLLFYLKQGIIFFLSIYFFSINIDSTKFLLNIVLLGSHAHKLFLVNDPDFLTFFNFLVKRNRSLHIK